MGAQARQQKRCQVECQDFSHPLNPVRLLKPMDWVSAGVLAVQEQDQRGEGLVPSTEGMAEIGVVEG